MSTDTSAHAVEPKPTHRQGLITEGKAVAP
jgi:hypothetical protein